MATAATAPTIEDFITCPVCQEIYYNPKVLICQHSLCQQCVKSMLEHVWNPCHARKGHQRELTCPICRTVTKETQIKSDLKTKGILDTTEAKGRRGSGYYGKTRLDESVKLCTLCQKLPVYKKCKECEHLLCQTCSNCHLDIPACKNHHITNLDSVIKHTRTNLTAIKNKLSHSLLITKKRQESINFYETDNETAYVDLIKIADTWKEENIELINQQHQKITDEILKIKQEDLQDILPLKEGVNKKEKKILEGIAMFDKITDESNSATFLGQSERTIPKLESIISSHDITLIPVNIKQSRLLNTKLQNGTNSKWDPTKSLTLQVHKRIRYNPFEYINIIKNQPNSSTAFPAELQLSPLDVSYSIKAEKSLKQIVFHDGCLWCLYEDRLDVFDINGTWLRSMAKNISQANNFIYVSDEVIVACMKTGLMSFHVAGKFNATLEDGAFCDVTTNKKNQIYALDYNNNKPTVTLYTKQWSKWNQTKIFDVPYSKLNPCNTILWNGTFLLMTACDDTKGTLYRYHQRRLILETYHRPGSLPRLCCADTKTGEVIITDSIKGNAYLFNPQDKSEKELFKLDTNSATGQGVNARHYSVTIDDEQGVWMCSYNHNIITRYVNTATEWHKSEYEEPSKRLYPDLDAT